MTVVAGARLGAYEITAKLGEGGMGVVWRATDTRLDRQVALKVLPASLADDAERHARFEREAKVLASLNHPHIATLYGLEHLEIKADSPQLTAHGSPTHPEPPAPIARRSEPGARSPEPHVERTTGALHVLVMELVEGEDLAARLSRGPIAIDEALPIARQIAEALEAAHEKGIVHRDLKPANVRVRPDGTVKVLDFGLAKALETGASGGAADPALSPTITHGATQAGLILGTAAYMAPEQAAGTASDRRADIWAFGVVLYEMLSGKRLFAGESVSHVLAGVLKDAPDFSLLPTATPPRVVELLRRCLRKKPRERLQAIGDARVVLEDAIANPDPDERPQPATLVAPRRSPLAPWVVAAAGLAATAVFAALWLGARGGAPAVRVVRSAIVTPTGTGFGDTFAISPDGRSLVFEAIDHATGGRALWLRHLDLGAPARVPSSDGGQYPFWSPDGTQIAFFADGKLKRLDPRNATAQTICDAPTPRGGAWGPDGRIVFSPAFRTGLSVVDATGGTPAPLTTLDAARHEKSHRFPVFLPGGTRVLFLAQTAEGGARDDDSAIEALDLASGTRTRIVTVNSSPLFAPPGQLLFWRDGVLLAQPFDPGRLTVSGSAVPVLEPVAYTQNEQALASISEEGTLVYLEGSRGTYSSMVWLDRRGLGLEVIRDRELFTDLAVSHDGKRMAYSVVGVGRGSADLWLQDFTRGLASRLTFEEGGEYDPVWSRDDGTIYYRSELRNDGVIVRRAADGSGGPEEVGTTPQGIWPLAASGDGRFLVAGAVGATTNMDLLRFDLETHETTPLVATPSNDRYPALSPDDRLLAYASEDSGRWEVYVMALGTGRGTWQISTAGGLIPRWRADGRELFFLNRPDRLMAVDVEPGEVPRFAAPRELFRQPMESFDVAPDGQRFVALRAADSDVARPLTLITGWTRLVAVQ